LWKLKCPALIYYAMKYAVIKNQIVSPKELIRNNRELGILSRMALDKKYDWSILI